MDLATIRRSKRVEKHSFGGLQGCAAGAARAFRTVSRKRVLGSSGSRWGKDHSFGAYAGLHFWYTIPSLRKRSGREHPVAANENKKIFIAPDEGAYLPVLDIAHKVPSESLGGAVTIVEWGLPPGVMIPPHTHSREHECNYVLKGELTCDVGGEIVVAPVGSYVVKPRGVYHA